MRIFLPAYFLIHGFAISVWRVIQFRRAGGAAQPIILGDPETAHGYISRMGTWLVLAIAAVIGFYSFWPEGYAKLGPIDLGPLAQPAGVALLLASLALTVAAQAQMGRSWRVGIETADKTEIVSHGLYRYSRNPIYAGVYLTNVGLFLCIPCVATAVLLVFQHVTLQILIRLEEAHMLKMQGEPYREYLRQVRRWI